MNFQVPDGVAFECAGIDKITTPHPYCITSKHVAVASDFHCGLLNESAIQDAEERGAKCGVRGCHLSYEKHVTQKVLVVVLPDDHPKDLNAIPGLCEWLKNQKDNLVKEGVDGIIFPKKSQRS